MKKLLWPFLVILLLTTCKKEISTDKVQEKIGSVASKTNQGKIDVCHRRGNSSWQTINISVSALPAHLAHGDIVPDADGDGFTKVNPCGNGNQDDCDDNNNNINPGATEICDNGIDDNCNGQIDENCITSVTICNQDWMVKNLDVSKYRNGDDIPQVTDPTEWSGLTTGAWCWYENISANGTTYGKLYNWYAVNDPRGLAPVGWHVPSYAEWITLSDCLGGESVAGGKMKEAGFDHWGSPNTDATNSSGFTGLPAGYRSFTPNFGQFFNRGAISVWWSSTEFNTTLVWNSTISLHFGGLYLNLNDKPYGMSVRCVRD
jgi:uncharacterized protein (TIGR02145 family)